MKTNKGRSEEWKSGMLECWNNGTLEDHGRDVIACKDENLVDRKLRSFLPTASESFREKEWYEIEMPYSKYQKTNNFQYSNSTIFKPWPSADRGARFGTFGFWSFEFIWNLFFVFWNFFRPNFNEQKVIASLALLLFVVPAYSQLPRVEPPNWWVGMQENKLQLLVQGENISDAEVKLEYPGVTLEKVHKADNKNFLFLDLSISDQAKAGSFDIQFSTGKKKKLTYKYELKEREKGRWAHKGLDQTDVMYLITPDRFANGDPANDEVKGLKEGKNMDFHSGRFGGDLKGISSKINYLEELGITAVWLNPVLENDMPEYSYHGYATTDYYKVDARFGSNEEYKKLTDDLHSRKIKMVMDMVFNHCGSHHWWMKDMPFEDWVHYYPEYVNTNHAKSALSDPYAAKSDIELMERGWFVSVMPDLNHDNPFMANYLIQNSIWWIEYVGLDGIRMDTYFYNKKEFMADWAKKIHREYPNFYLVGETWLESEAETAFWALQDPEDKTSYNSLLNSVTDFPLCFSLHEVFGNNGDVMDLYSVLAKDFLYYDPMMNKIFADNHDMDRFYHTIGEDLEKFKLAMTFLFTTRGIPQLYYGTEILMKGYGEHGVLREMFPGGWPGDTRNAFTKEGRTAEENEAFDHIRKLLDWRKGSDAIKNGSLKHFVPYDNLYVYNRQSAKESVLVIINNSSETVKPDMSRFAEVLNGYDGGVDVLSGVELIDLNTIEIKGNKALVLKLNPQLKSGR